MKKKTLNLVLAIKQNKYIYSNKNKRKNNKNPRIHTDKLIQIDFSFQQTKN